MDASNGRNAWSRLDLIVLVRSQPEEAVLGCCISEAQALGHDVADLGCCDAYSNSYPVGVDSLAFLFL
jgi:hypothetical protein